MTNFTRRTVLKGAAATGIATIGAPALISSAARASSGTVNVFAWGDYIQDNIKDAFEKKTGITLNLSTFGSNDEAENKLRASGGKGFDVIFPSITNRSNYDDGDLLAPIDEKRVELGNIIPSIYRDSVKLGATRRGKRYLLPFDWGTEAITWDSSVHNIPAGELSYGHMWKKDGLKGQVAFRQKSALVSLAIYLDAIGEVPSNRALDLYKTEEDMRRVLDKCLAYMLERKENFGAFWNNATEATSAFTDAGCTIGQTWDTTGILLNRDIDPKWQYSAPKEGAMTWMDSMGIPSGAENVDQAYEFINFMLTPEVGGMFANNTGYNSAVKGADAFLSDANKAAFQMAYPGSALDNLWWYPADTPWFSRVRGEYVERITNA